MMIKKTSFFSLVLAVLLSATGLAGQDIHAAVRKGDLAAAKAAVEEDPGQIEALNASRSTPLIVAASAGHIQVIAFLLDKGADIQAVNKWGMTALHYAVDKGHVEVAKMLLEKGADIDGHKDFPYTPLHIASTSGAEDMVDLLLSKGANVNILSRAGFPLHRAVNSGNTNTIHLGGQGKISVQGVTFAYAEEKDEEGMGCLNYLIDADGFNYYYSGFFTAPLELHKKHLENMAKGGRTCDVAFLLLSARGENRDYIDQVIDVLKPKVVFLHMALQTPDEKTVTTLQEKYPSVKFMLARDPGERFHYKAN